MMLYAMPFQYTSWLSTAFGRTCFALIENAFELSHESSLLIDRSVETHQLIRLTYGQMSIECHTLAKYWKRFVAHANDYIRLAILKVADTSPAYICCLLTGLLCQTVVILIHSSKSIDALKYILTIDDPVIIVVSEQYFEKMTSRLSMNPKRLVIIIYLDEEQWPA